jgi:hypothetical protein
MIVFGLLLTVLARICVRLRLNRTFDQFKIPLEERDEEMVEEVVLQVYGARSPSAHVPKKTVTLVRVRGSVVPGKSSVKKCVEKLNSHWIL